MGYSTIIIFVHGNLDIDYITNSPYTIRLIGVNTKMYL